MNKFNIILLIPIILLNFSCNEKSIESSETLKPIYSTNQSTYYSNTFNPYNFVGKMHNDGLDFIYNYYNVEPNPNSITEAQAIEGMKQFHLSQNGSTSNLTLAELDTYFKQFGKMVYDGPQTFSDIISSSTFSQNYNSHFTNLYNNIDNWVALMENPNRDNSIHPIVNYLNSVERIEIQISNDNSLTEPERAKLFVTAAITRYSFQYWFYNAIYKPYITTRTVKSADRKQWVSMTAIGGATAFATIDHAIANAQPDWWERNKGWMKSDLKGAGKMLAYEGIIGGVGIYTGAIATVTPAGIAAVVGASLLAGMLESVFDDSFWY